MTIADLGVNDLYVQAGSFDPVYWRFRHPLLHTDIDLTAAGYEVEGVVVSHEDDSGDILATLGDGDFLRTATGRIYFQPTTDTTTSWEWRLGYGQFTLITPEAGRDLRFWSGRIHNSPAY